MKRKIVIALLGLIGLLFLAWLIPFVYFIFVPPSDSNPVEAACELARLALPPEGSTILKTQDMGNPFAATSRFIFKSDKNAIEKWLDLSPGIKIAVITEYNQNLVLLPVTELPETFENGVEYFFIPKSATWFAPSIKNGVKYEIPQDKNANYGTVYVDRDTWTVYVNASHS